MRHGSKFPKKEVKNEIADLEVFKTYFNNQFSKDENALLALQENSIFVISKIMKWQNKTASAEAKKINEHGLLTMKKLGQRWNSRLLNIVVNIESKKEIEFNSAKEERCSLSGQEFLKEFLKINKKSTVEIPPFELPKKGDHRIKLDKGKTEEDGPKVQKTEEEVENIYYNEVCPEKTCYLIQKLNNLLFPNGHGSDKRVQITNAKVKAMYMACANSFVYEYTNEEEGHAWCYLFDNNDILMFEGMHDYQYYIKNGYNDIKTKNYGRPIMKDILNFLHKTETKKFKLFVAHTSNCLSLMTGFRMFQDEEKITLKSMTKDDKMSNRKWRSSFTGNYGCNIMVVVYDCEDANFDITEEVSIFLNETPLEMVFENKRTCTLCPIKDVINLIEELLNDKPTEEELIKYENLQKRKKIEETIDDPMNATISVEA